jgi:hypothetical protein
VVPQDVIDSAMRKLATDLNARERAALLTELLGGPVVVKLHRSIMTLLTKQVFRRIKLKGFANDPLEKVDPASTAVSSINLRELLNHDLKIITATLDILEEDSQHVVEKMKIVFQRAQANILISRIRKAQQNLVVQSNGIVKDVQADLLRRREERLGQELARLAKLRESISAKQRKNWTLENRKLFPMTKIVFANKDEWNHLQTQGCTSTTSSALLTLHDEEEYMELFLARMQRWFEYKRVTIKRTPQQLLQRILGGGDGRPQDPPVKLFSMEVSNEVARRMVHGSVAARQKPPLPSLKKVHPALTFSPVFTDRQKEQIAKVVASADQRTTTPPLDVSNLDLPSSRPLSTISPISIPTAPSQWVDATIRVGRMAAASPPLPAIASGGTSPPPTRQTVRGGPGRRVGGASI